MKKTIYNVYIPVESQEQADRLKQLCIDNGLPYSKDDLDFFLAKNLVFRYSFVFQEFQMWFYDEEFTQSTEQEFIELLKQTK